MTKLTKVEPQIIGKSLEGDNAQLRLMIPEDLDYFNGHFPNAPILAGVVQLDWAVKYGIESLNMPASTVKNLEVLKFQVVITPGLNVTLSFTRKSDFKFTFKYESEKGVHASGRVVLEA
ncbi:ApeI family dehydratase [Flocculibacter collagenilyticus]|uniref:ApeI family dehydratase n=1 Tax=Flocculibacter collagenilyticus TaxID=2744479 RepID=UPI001F458EC5|nr:thioester dehydrase [Flocculibacter collagenilyticus]